MPAWAYWVLFVVAGIFAIAAAKRLDDLERKRWERDLRAARARDAAGAARTE